MHIIPHHEKLSRITEKGFSLVVVLFFVGLIATLIAMSLQGQRGAAQRDQARAAGWHLAEVTKAARIYVRDRSLLPADTYHKTKLTGGGIAITVDTLRLAGLLPGNFPDANILGQAVRIYAANYPVNGDPADSDTVASAYVVLQRTAETQNSPILMQYLVEGAREHGLYTNAPVFDEDGTNISDACGGTAGIAKWSTDCLNGAQFASITGSAFTAGSLIVPSWLADTPDTRAVLRFPRPENPGYNTMLTALDMAPVTRDADGSCADDDEVQIYDYTQNPPALIKTGVCRVQDDVPNANPALYVDNRKDILNVSALSVDTVIAQPQANDYQAFADLGGGVTGPSWTDYSSIGTGTEVFHVTGNLIANNDVHATGRMPNPDPSIGTVTFDNALSVDNNVSVSEDFTVNGATTIRRATAQSLDKSIGGTTTIQGQVTAAQIATGTLNVKTKCGKNNAAGTNCGYVTQMLDTGDEEITTVTADFMNGVTIDDTMTMTSSTRGAGSGVPALVVYRGEGNAAVTVDETMVIDNTLTLKGTATFSDRTWIVKCAGGANCPKVQREMPGVFD